MMKKKMKWPLDWHCIIKISAFSPCVSVCVPLSVDGVVLFQLIPLCAVPSLSASTPPRSRLIGNMLPVLCMLVAVYYPLPPPLSPPFPTSAAVRFPPFGVILRQPPPYGPSPSRALIVFVCFRYNNT